MVYAPLASALSLRKRERDPTYPTVSSSFPIFFVSLVGIVLPTQFPLTYWCCQSPCIYWGALFLKPCSSPPPLWRFSDDFFPSPTLGRCSAIYPLFPLADCHVMRGFFSMFDEFSVTVGVWGVRRGCVFHLAPFINGHCHLQKGVRSVFSLPTFPSSLSPMVLHRCSCVTLQEGRKKAKEGRKSINLITFCG